MLTVKVEGRNIAGLWNLACVHQLTKNNKEGSPCVKVASKMDNETCMYDYEYAYIDDEIEVESQQSETGKVISDLPF